MARVAEQAERFDDMVYYLNLLCSQKQTDFTTEERNLLSVGYKNYIGTKRTALRTLAVILNNPKYTKYKDGLTSYKNKVEDELYSNCMNIVNSVKEHCVGKAETEETKAFFSKMVGDYFRYVSECATGQQLENVKTGALENY